MSIDVRVSRLGLVIGIGPKGEVLGRFGSG